jgi:hypothetical protein
VTGTCKCGDEPSGCIKFGDFLDYLRTFGFSKRSLFHGSIALVGWLVS